MKKYLAILSMLLVSACASVPMTTPQQDQAAKQFAAPPSDKSNLYIFRDEQFGAALPMGVTLDGRMLGKTAAKTYFFLTIPPGRHSVVSSAENDSVLDWDAEAGKEYYVWQEVKMGLMMARSKLHFVAPERGQEGVLASKRILDQYDPQ